MLFAPADQIHEEQHGDDGHQNEPAAGYDWNRRFSVDGNPDQTAAQARADRGDDKGSIPSAAFAGKRHTHSCLRMDIYMVQESVDGIIPLYTYYDGTHMSSGGDT